MTIADRLIQAGLSSGDEMGANKQIGDKVKSDYLKCTEKFVVYQKKCNADKKLFSDHEKLEAMTTAVAKMADVLGSQKNANHGLEKLSVPTWDGSRKSYTTWKNEFNYWMKKYKQDNDEQLQRLRNALPKNSFRTDQVRPSTTIEQGWKILDTEFGDQRKLMDELVERNQYKSQTSKKGFNITSVRSHNSWICEQYGTKPGCAVTNASEAPFVVSQLLSKLDAKDNVEFAAGAIKILAKASKAKYPEAAKELCEHVYVDDIRRLP